MSSRSEAKPFIFTEGYYPDQPLFNGGIPGSVYAGLNAVFESNGYVRTFAGVRDIGETYNSGDLAYTADVTADNPIVTASSGTFLADVVAFQIILINRLIYVVEEVLSNTQIRVSPTPSATVSSVAIRRVPALHAVDEKRAGLFAGSVRKFRDEAIFTAGLGEVKFNGASISAALNSFTSPQVAYPLPNGTYDSRPAGFTKPDPPTVISTTGGTKNMPNAMTYSFKLTKKRLGFPGYGLASEAVEQNLPNVGDRFQVTFPTMDTSQGQTSWILWVSKAATGSAQRGPWFRYDAEFTTGPAFVEWRDGELTEQLNDNNFPPPKALYVGSMDDVLIFGSCYGKPDSGGNPTAPGPGFACAKPNNPESFAPAASAFNSPAENVRGMWIGGARLYAGSNNYLHMFTVTGSSTTPLVGRSYGQTGYWHQYSGCMVGDTFYGMTGDVLVRTTEEGDLDSGFSDIQARVKTELASFVPQRTIVGHDPRNGWVVVFHSNHRLSGSFWITRVISFNYKTGKWNSPTELVGSGADFTVTSCATVGGELYFTTQDGKCYQWDAGSTTINGFIAPVFQDFGSAQLLKTARYVQLTGKFNGTLGIYRDYDTDSLIAGTGSPPSRTFNNPSYTAKHHPLWKLNYKGKSLSMRVSFSMPPNTQVIDTVELSVDVRQIAGY